jgi:hypothetical protein
MRSFPTAIVALLAVYPAAAQPLAGATREVIAIIERADANGDGRIDRAELTSALKRAESEAPAAFEFYWSNRTASAAGAGIAAPDAREAGRIAIRVLAEADADGDGAISAEEAQAFLASRSFGQRQTALYALALADIDFDGVATKDEVEGLRRRIEAQGGTAAAEPEATGEDVTAAKADARKDFMEGKEREREAIEQVWRQLSDANNVVPVTEMRRELFGGAY